MQPQDNIQTQYTPPVNQPPNSNFSKKSKLPLLLSAVLALVIIVAGVGTFLLLGSLNDKDAELSSLGEELESVKAELSSAQIKIDELDNPQEKNNDIKRKSDLTKFVTELNNFAANNNGNYPTTEPSLFIQEFESKYITDKIVNFVDPDTNIAYTVTPVAAVQTPPGVTLGNIQYQWPGKCSGSEFNDDATNRQAAARLILQSGEIYCLDS